MFRSSLIWVLPLVVCGETKPLSNNGIEYDGTSTVRYQPPNPLLFPQRTVTIPASKTQTVLVIPLSSDVPIASSQSSTLTESGTFIELHRTQAQTKNPLLEVVSQSLLSPTTLTPETAAAQLSVVSTLQPEQELVPHLETDIPIQSNTTSATLEKFSYPLKIQLSLLPMKDYNTKPAANTLTPTINFPQSQIVVDTDLLGVAGLQSCIASLTTQVYTQPQVVSAPCFNAIMRLIQSHQLSLDAASQSTLSNALLALTNTNQLSTADSGGLEVSIYIPGIQKASETSVKPAASIMPVDTVTRTHEVTASHKITQQNTSSQSFQSTASQSLQSAVSQSFLNVDNQPSPADTDYPLTNDRQALEASHSLINLPIPFETPSQTKTDEFSYQSESAIKQTQISTSKTVATSQSQIVDNTLSPELTASLHSTLPSLQLSLPVASAATQSQEVTASHAITEQNTNSQSYQSTASQSLQGAVSQSFLNVDNQPSPADTDYPLTNDRQTSEASHSLINLPKPFEISSQTKTDEVSYQSESAIKQTQISTSKTVATSQSQIVDNTLSPELTASLHSTLPSLQVSLPVASTATQSQEVTASHAITQQNSNSQSYQSTASQSLQGAVSQSFLNVDNQPSPADTDYPLTNDRQTSEASHSLINLPKPFEISSQTKTDEVSYQSESAIKQTQISTSKTVATSQSQIVDNTLSPELTASLHSTLPSLQVSLPVASTATQSQEVTASHAITQQNTNSQSYQSTASQSLQGAVSQSFLNVYNQPSPADADYPLTNDRQALEASHSLINLPIPFETPSQTKTDEVSYQSESAIKQTQISTSKTVATSQSQIVDNTLSPELTASLHSTLPSLQVSLPVASTAIQSQEVTASHAITQQNTNSQSYQSTASQSLQGAVSQSFLNVYNQPSPADADYPLTNDRQALEASHSLINLPIPFETPSQTKTDEVSYQSESAIKQTQITTSKTVATSQSQIVDNTLSPELTASLHSTLPSLQLSLPVASAATQSQEVTASHAITEQNTNSQSYQSTGSQSLQSAVSQSFLNVDNQPSPADTDYPLTNDRQALEASHSLINLPIPFETPSQTKTDEVSYQSESAIKQTQISTSKTVATSQSQIVDNTLSPELTASLHTTLPSLQVSLPVSSTATQSQEEIASHAITQQNTSSQSYQSTASRSLQGAVSQSFLNVDNQPSPADTDYPLTNDRQALEASHSLINLPIPFETPSQTKTDEVSYQSESAIKQTQISTSKTVATSQSQIVDNTLSPELTASLHTTLPSLQVSLPVASTATQSQEETASHAITQQNTSSQSYQSTASRSLQGAVSQSFLNVDNQPSPADTDYPLTNDRQALEASHSLINLPIPFETPSQTKTDEVSYQSESAIKQTQISTSKTVATSQSQIVDNTLSPELTASLHTTLPSLQVSLPVASTATQSQEETASHAITQQNTSSQSYQSTASRSLQGAVSQSFLNVDNQPSPADTDYPLTNDRQALEASHSLINLPIPFETPSQTKTDQVSYESESAIKQTQISTSKTKVTSQSQIETTHQAVNSEHESMSQSGAALQSKPIFVTPGQISYSLQPTHTKSYDQPSPQLATTEMSTASDPQSQIIDNILSPELTVSLRLTLPSLRASLPDTSTATKSQEITASHAITQQNSGSQSFQSTASQSIQNTASQSFQSTVSQSFLNVDNQPSPAETNYQLAAVNVNQLYTANDRKASQATHCVKNLPIPFDTPIQIDTDQVSYESDAALKQTQINTSKTEVTSQSQVETTHQAVISEPTLQLEHESQSETTLQPNPIQTKTEKVSYESESALKQTQISTSKTEEKSQSQVETTHQAVISEPTLHLEHEFQSETTLQPNPIQTKTGQVSYESESTLKQTQISTSKTEVKSQSQIETTHQTVKSESESTSQSQTALQSNPILLAPEQFSYSLQQTHTKPNDQPSPQLATPETLTTNIPLSHIVDNTISSELTSSLRPTLTSFQPSLETASITPIGTTSQSQEVTASHGIIQQNTISQSLLNTASQLSLNDLLQPAPPTVAISQSAMVNATQLSEAIDRQTSEASHSIYKTMTSEIPIQLRKESTYIISKPDPIPKPQFVRSSETNLTSQSQVELTPQSLPKPQLSVPPKSRSLYIPRPRPLLRSRPVRPLPKSVPQANDSPTVNILQPLLSPEAAAAQSFVVATLQPERNLVSHPETESPLPSNSIYPLAEPSSYATPKPELSNTPVKQYNPKHVVTLQTPTASVDQSQIVDNTLSPALTASLRSTLPSLQASLLVASTATQSQELTTSHTITQKNTSSQSFQSTVSQSFPNQPSPADTDYHLAAADVSQLYIANDRQASEASHPSINLLITFETPSQTKTDQVSYESESALKQTQISTSKTQVTSQSQIEKTHQALKSERESISQSDTALQSNPILHTPEQLSYSLQQTHIKPYDQPSPQLVTPETPTASVHKIVTQIVDNTVSPALTASLRPKLSSFQASLPVSSTATQSQEGTASHAKTQQNTSSQSFQSTTSQSFQSTASQAFLNVDNQPSPADTDYKVAAVNVSQLYIGNDRRASEASYSSINLPTTFETPSQTKTDQVSHESESALKQTQINTSKTQVTSQSQIETTHQALKSELGSMSQSGEALQSNPILHTPEQLSYLLQQTHIKTYDQPSPQLATTETLTANVPDSQIVDLTLSPAVIVSLRPIFPSLQASLPQSTQSQEVTASHAVTQQNTSSQSFQSTASQSFLNVDNQPSPTDTDFHVAAGNVSQLYVSIDRQASKASHPLINLPLAATTSILQSQIPDNTLSSELTASLRPTLTSLQPSLEAASITPIGTTSQSQVVTASHGIIPLTDTISQSATVNATKLSKVIDQQTSEATHSIYKTITSEIPIQLRKESTYIAKPEPQFVRSSETNLISQSQVELAPQSLPEPQYSVPTKSRSLYIPRPRPLLRSRPVRPLPKSVPQANDQSFVVATLQPERNLVSHPETESPLQSNSIYLLAEPSSYATPKPELSNTPVKQYNSKHAVTAQTPTANIAQSQIVDTLPEIAASLSPTLVSLQPSLATAPQMPTTTTTQLQADTAHNVVIQQNISSQSSQSSLDSLLLSAPPAVAISLLTSANSTQLSVSTDRQTVESFHSVSGKSTASKTFVQPEIEAISSVLKFDPQTEPKLSSHQEIDLNSQSQIEITHQPVISEPTRHLERELVFQSETALQPNPILLTPEKSSYSIQSTHTKPQLVTPEMPIASVLQSQIVDNILRPELSASLPLTDASLQPSLVAASTRLEDTANQLQKVTASHGKIQQNTITSSFLNTGSQTSLNDLPQPAPPTAAISQSTIINATQLSKNIDRQTLEASNSIYKTMTFEIPVQLKNELKPEPQLVHSSETNLTSQLQVELTPQSLRKPQFSVPTKSRSLYIPPLLHSRPLSKSTPQTNDSPSVNILQPLLSPEAAAAQSFVVATLQSERNLISQSETESPLQSNSIYPLPDPSSYLTPKPKLTFTPVKQYNPKYVVTLQTPAANVPQSQIVDTLPENAASLSTTLASLQPKLATTSTAPTTTITQLQVDTAHHVTIQQNISSQSSQNAATLSSLDAFLQSAPPPRQLALANLTQLSETADQKAPEASPSLLSILIASKIPAQPEIDAISNEPLPKPTLIRPQELNLTSQLQIDALQHVPKPIIISEREPLLHFQAAVVADPQSSGAVLTSPHLLDTPQVPVQSGYEPDSFTPKVKSMQEPVPETKPNPISLDPVQSAYSLKLNLQPSLVAVPGSESKRANAKLRAVLPSLLPKPNSIWQSAFGRQTHRTTTEYSIASSVQRVASSRSGPICKEENGYFAVNNECDTYIQCKQYNATKISCPDGLHFNPNAKHYEYPCVDPVMVNCIAGIKKRKSKLRGQCQKQYGLFPTKDGDCSKYIMCNAGVASIMNCPAGLVFNPTIQNCDWLANVPQCNSQAFKDYVCPNPTIDDSSLDSDMIFKYKYGQHCTLYVACQRGYPRLLSCENGLAFDEVSHSCVKAEYVQGCTPNTA